MRRLVFCFDGTWNTLDAPNPTNVVIMAESITPMGKGGVPQIIHYDPGVGTGHDDKWKGGLLGEGLIDKIADAYTFLIFNYEVGDEIFVFGFSRGAFTARAFVGFIRHVGIIQRRSAGSVTEAVKLYEKRQPGEGPDRDDLLAYRERVPPRFALTWRRTLGASLTATAMPPGNLQCCESKVGRPAHRRGYRCAERHLFRPFCQP